MRAEPSRTVLVTGGSSGLGWQCARQLLACGSWHVVITSPDSERARQAAAELAQTAACESITGLALCLDSQQDIRRFAQQWAALDLPPLQGLVGKAGRQAGSAGALSKDGIEMIFAVNYLGHFLLVNLLLQSLQAPARVVFVSSSTHDPERRHGISAPPWSSVRALAFPPYLGSTQPAPGKAKGEAYAASKLCTILCAYELDRCLRRSGLSTPNKPISSNAFDPGLMPGTGLARAQGRVFRLLWHWLLPLLRFVIPAIRTPADSGRALAGLVHAAELETISGRYFDPSGEQRSSAESYRHDYAKDLWEGSVTLCDLSLQESLLAQSAPPGMQ